MKNIKLSEHFTLAEFLRSDKAAELGIENVPDVEAVVNMCALCHRVLEPLREKFGKPIPVYSGYRCPELNRAVGGAERSYHMSGRAADIPMKPGYIAYIRDHLPHKELINEGSWIHVAL